MNKEDVLQYLNKEKACNSAIDWFIDQSGTLEEIYNSCAIDWRIWLHEKLGLDPEPYKRYKDAMSIARKQLALNTTLDAYEIFRKAKKASWHRWNNETMKDWGIVEKALQEAIKNDD